MRHIESMKNGGFTKITQTNLSMGLFDFLKSKSNNNQFVSKDMFVKNRDKQIQMTRQTLNELRKHDVTVDEELKLEYFFYTNTAEKAEKLALEIAKMEYTVQHGVSAGDDKLFIVTGWTTKIRMAEDNVKQWVKQMCELGGEFDCEFDGWGTTPSQEEEENQTDGDAYEGLRNMAFEVTSEQLGLKLSGNTKIVYGVVMDWEMNGAIASTVAYQTGDVSLYLSSGGAIIGGGQHRNVKIAAKNLVSASQSFLENAIKAESTSLPSTNEVKFYLLTNQGIFMGQEQMESFENRASPWLVLFEEGNKVLSELRTVNEALDGAN